MIYKNISTTERRHNASPRTWPREGVIIEWPLNDLFKDGHEVIILSRMAVIIIF